jgi:hypothetical protein
MIMDSKLTNIFWVHVVHTIVHIQNKGILRNNCDKNPYEIWKGIPMNLNHFRVLEENATSKENMEEWESLIVVLKNEYLLGTQAQGKNTNSSIQGSKQLWKTSM